MQILDHNKAEWARMAEAAYAAGNQIVGLRFIVASTVPAEYDMSTEYFDSLQRQYRAWLCFNEMPTH